MKYLIHYSYTSLGDKRYDWAWTDKEASVQDLKKLIDSLKTTLNADWDSVTFQGIYEASSIVDIRYSSDGSIRL